MAKPTKYIFVTGGVISGLGKGITAASIANTLKARGLKVNLQKCDPYLNVDAGILNPREHGECFVTFDGAETDLDLGHYERFLDQELTSTSSLMSGKVLLKVISDERAGKYAGEDVQIIPHLTEAIQKFIVDSGEGFDVHIVEIGGTVGDYESLSFIEAIRELGVRVGQENRMYVHLAYLPFLGTSKETKTKPAQNSVRDLRSLGISPDVLVARSETIPGEGIIDKLSLFCGVKPEAIVMLPNASTIYEVPLTLEDSGICDYICKNLGLKASKPKLKSWQKVVEAATNPHPKSVTVGVIAKYLDNTDTYMSVFEAIKAAAWANKVGVNIRWIEAESLTNSNIKKVLQKVDGILVPGGFGERGVEGMIRAAQYAMETEKPYLGLCLGLHVAVIAAARKAGLADANSREFSNKSLAPVIDTMPDQKGKENTGGTMRLGNYPCKLVKGSLAGKLYGTKDIVERHRHRYECNNDYRDLYNSWGLKVAGTSPDNRLVEMIEGNGSAFLLCSQFHPEFKSRPNKPHPMFLGFIKSILENSK